MILRSATRWLILLGLLVPTGCYYPVRDKIDAVVCDIAKQPFDVQKLEAADQLPIMPSAEDEKIKQTAYRPDGDELVQKGSDNQRPDKGNERPKSNEDLKQYLRRYPRLREEIIEFTANWRALSILDKVLPTPPSDPATEKQLLRRARASYRAMARRHGE